MSITGFCYIFYQILNWMMRIVAIQCVVLATQFDIFLHFLKDTCNGELGKSQIQCIDYFLI